MKQGILKKASHNIYVWAAAILVLRGVLMIFPPLADTTESRYALIAKDIVQTGDWVTPHVWFDGCRVPFLGKPPLFFWSSAGCMKLFGINAFSARLPSLLAFALTLTMLVVILRRYLSSRAAANAAFLTITSVVLLAASGLVIVDILLTLCVTGAVLGFFAFCREKDKRYRDLWSLWTAGMLGLGFMTKGPIVLVMFGLPVLIWTGLFRRWQDLRNQQWYFGITLFGLIVVPWFISAESQNPGFLRYFFINENLLRFTVHEYGDRYGSGHEHIRGTAILYMILAAVPWSFMMPFRMFSLRKELPVKSLRKDPFLMYFFLIVVVNMLFLALARQLLMTYLFPLVPAFIVLLTMLIDRFPQLLPLENRHFKYIGISVLMIVAVAGILSIPYSDGRSCKTILDKAQAFKKPGDQIYFVRRVPFSAYYYASDDVIPHVDESEYESLNAVLSQQKPVLLASREKYFQHFENLPVSGRLKILAKSGDYVLARIETSTAPSQGAENANSMAQPLPLPQ